MVYTTINSINSIPYIRRQHTAETRGWAKKMTHKHILGFLERQSTAKYYMHVLYALN